MRDTHTEKPKPGKFVLLTGVPQGFLDDLPAEDQRAISDAIGKRVVLNEYDKTGRGELQFTDSEGVIHLIYVSPEYFRRQ